MTDNGIKLHPVVGWRLASLADGSVAIAMSHVPNGPAPRTMEELAQRAEVFPMRMTSAQVLAFASALLKAVGQAQELEKRRIDDMQPTKLGGGRSTRRAMN